MRPFIAQMSSNKEASRVAMLLNGAGWNAWATGSFVRAVRPRPNLTAFVTDLLNLDAKFGPLHTGATV